MFESFYSLLSGLLKPLADCTLCYSKCLGNVFLLPAFFMQFPSLHSSLFTPIFRRYRFLAHTSFSRITWLFSLVFSTEVNMIGLEEAFLQSVQGQMQRAELISSMRLPRFEEGRDETDVPSLLKFL